MSRNRRYMRWADGVCLALISLYLAVAAFSINSLTSVDTSSTYTAPAQAARVLGETSVVKFPEQDNAPSPNSILALVNEERVKAGMQPLRANTTLGEIAKRRADDMADKNYYAHRGSDGLFYYDYLSGSGAEDHYSCENLDLQFSLAPSRYVNDWLQSSLGHRKCMLNDQVKDAGYAVRMVDNLENGQKAYIVVAIHGRVE